VGATAPQPGALSCVALFRGLTDAQQQRRRAITEQKEVSASHEGAEGFDQVILEALQVRETRACYEPTPRMPVACWRKRQAKATKCSPARVAGSLS